MARTEYIERPVKSRSEYLDRIRKARRVMGAVLAFSLVVFIVIAALAVINEGFSKFVAVLSSINLFYYAAAFVVVFAGYLLRFPKWEMYLKRLGVRIDAKKNLAIYLSMYSMDITPGRWGRSVVSYTINKITGVGFGRTFPAIVADIFTDFLGFSAISIVFAFFVRQYVVLSLVITALLLLPFLFLYHKRPFEFIKRKLGHLKSLRRFFEVGTLYFKYNNRLGAWSYLYSMAFTIPAMLLDGFGFYLVIASFGVPISLVFLPTVFFIYSSSLLLGMITGVPGTLGVTDAAIISYLTLFFSGIGITFGVASTLTIFFRIVDIWFVEGFGFAALLYTLRYWKD